MKDMPVTKKVISYIEENLDKELSLGKIAEALSYSKFYLARTFKEDTGITLYKYIQGRRLSEAAWKLAETKRPIVEIAFEAGYGSQQAFTKAFRRMYVCTPQEYRRTKALIFKQGRIQMEMRRPYAVLSSGMAEGRMAA